MSRDRVIYKKLRRMARKQDEEKMADFKLVVNNKGILARLKIAGMIIIGVW